MYRSMTGLGLLESSPMGVRSVARPTCVTSEERAEANSKCPTEGMIRGLGLGTRATGPMSGRLSAFSPCEVGNLPDCGTPTCIDQYTAGLIAECIAGKSSNPEFDCASLYTYALSRLPFCPGGVLPPIPACLTPDVVAIVDYCRAYPAANGPDKAANAACWLITHDAAYWAQLQAVKKCGTGQPLDPPRHVTPPPPMPPLDHGPSGPTEGDSEASMSGMLGILALVAVAGGGYYMYRKYKK